MTDKRADPESLTDEGFIAAFEAGRLPLAAFDHRAHVRAGYLYVSAHGLGGGITRFAASLKAFAARHGKPGLYHETVTVAFLALINERVVLSGARDWDTFIAANADLLDRRILTAFYEPEELASAEARAVFRLPRRRGTNRNQSESTPAQG
jgi:hypothetical protein